MTKFSEKGVILSHAQIFVCFDDAPKKSKKDFHFCFSMSLKEADASWAEGSATTAMALEAPGSHQRAKEERKRVNKEND